MQARSLKRFLAVVTFAAFAPLAFAQFQPGMNVEQTEAEVKVRFAAGATLAQMARQALAAGLNPGLVTAALINATDNASGVSVDAVTQGALSAGVPLAAVQTAIAASPFTGSPATTGTAGTSTPTGSAGAGGGGTGSSTASPS